MRKRLLCPTALALGLMAAACGGEGAAVAPLAPAAASATAPTATAVLATPAATQSLPGATASSPRSAAPSATPVAAPAKASSPVPQRVGLECVVPVLRRHPIDLAPYDAASGRAGDVQFVSRTMGNVIYSQFGYVVPAALTSSGQDKSNPQPTYLAPLGTPVRAAASGVVDRISDLWSTPTYGDVSVMIRPDGLPASCYVVVEAEHVLNPRVAVGDRVSAGQVIAEVGPLNSQGNSGLGLVELGILTGAGNGRPMHVCPYAYFAPDVAAAQIGMLTRLMADWESYTGDPTLWDEGAWVNGVPGCSSGPITE